MSYDKQYATKLKKEKQYEELFQYLSSFAESDNCSALNDLAICYYSGLGVEKDYSKSFYYDNKAANLGAPDSIAILGYDFECGIGVTADVKRAVELYEKSVSLGSTKGMTYLGLCFENGLGVNKDTEKAFSLYLRAAELGNARAQRFLGLCYENGTGTSENIAKAVYWYKKAAEQDNKIAQRWLAMCYENGDGVDVDTSKAIEWYSRAIENDDDISRVLLSCIYYDKFDDEEKDRLALSYLQEAVGNLEKDGYYYSLGCFKLARYYESGYLVECNMEQSFLYDKIAAEYGILGAMLSLANCYEKGLGTPIDNIKAVEWYEKSVEDIDDYMDKAECFLTIANIINDNLDEEKEKSEKYYKAAYTLFLQESINGNVDAFIQLGLLYYAGKGIERNYKKVFECFEKAFVKREDEETGYYIATCYIRGIGVDKNATKGYRILTDIYEKYKSISIEKHKSVPSALLLCFCSICGIGVKANIKFAKKLINELLADYSDDSFVSSYTNLYRGIMYFHGIGEKQDFAVAKEYFLLSPGIGSVLYAPLCDGDYSKAELLGLFYYGYLFGLSQPLSQNDKFAKYFFELSYDNGVVGPKGVDGLHCYLISEKKYKKAYEILSLSQEISPKCKRKLGQHLYYGCGTKRNIDAAIKNFDNAYMSGDDIARVYMACCYAYGIGIKKNEDEARAVLENVSFNNGSFSNVLRGLLIYTGNWGYEKNKEYALTLIKEYLENQRYNLYYRVLSSKRGDYYANIFIDNHLANLHNQFDERKRIKLFLPQALKLISLLIFKNPYSENLSKKEMLRILLSQNQVLIEQNRIYAENQAKISLTLGNIQTNTDAIPEIVEHQKEIFNLLHTIQDYVSKQKKALININTDDEAYNDFFDSVAARMNEALYHKGNASVEFEEAQLKGLFGEYWELLDEYTRKSLVSARVFLANSNSMAYSGLDYSGVCISTCSALEQELKLRFFTGYKAYLKERFKKDYSKWPKSMLYQERTENNSFTIGNLPYIFGGKKRDEQTGRRHQLNISEEERNLLKDYIDTISRNSSGGINDFLNADASGLSFIDRCEDVRCMYRNTAAHTESLSLKTATDCWRDVIGISRNDAAMKVGQVQGLIYDLVRMTKLPDC